MQHEVKEKIADALQAHLDQSGKSQNAFAKSIPGISPSLISNMLTEKWDLIRDEKWTLLATVLNQDTAVETGVFKRMTTLMYMSQENSQTKVFVDRQGSGKTFATEWYQATKQQSYYIRCCEWTKPLFMLNLLQAIGGDRGSLKYSEIPGEIKRLLSNKSKAVVIVDEVDKLGDHALISFIDLYNTLNGICGFFFCATDAFVDRMNKGVSKNKKGYRELESRFGGYYHNMNGYSTKQERIDAEKVCLSLKVPEEYVSGIVNKSLVRGRYDFRVMKERIRDYHAAQKIKKTQRKD